MTRQQRQHLRVLIRYRNKPPTVLSGLLNEWPVLVGFLMIAIIGNLIVQGPMGYLILGLTLGAIAAQVGLTMARIRIWPLTTQIVDWSKDEQFVNEKSTGNAL